MPARVQRLVIRLILYCCNPTKRPWNETGHTRRLVAGAVTGAFPFGRSGPRFGSRLKSLSLHMQVHLASSAMHVWSWSNRLNTQTKYTQL